VAIRLSSPSGEGVIASRKAAWQSPPKQNHCTQITDPAATIGDSRGLSFFR